MTHRTFIAGLGATAADVAMSASSVADKAPFTDYFAKALGRPIKLILPTNHTATVEAVGNDSVDMAHFGGLTYSRPTSGTA